MAATIVNNLTNVTLANDNTGFSVWKRDGTGGTPSAISETDVFIQGTGACSVKVSNQGVVLAYATGGINLSASGTHVYVWANMLAGGLMTNRNATNPGLAIFLNSNGTISGSNWSMWAVDGADTYPGGWVRYVIDVSKTATLTGGTLNLSSVQWIGMYCNTQPNVAKFDNLVVDRIDYTTAGTGLSVYGTSTTDDLFGDILTADEGTVNNKYGVVTSKEGIIYVRGTIELGDDAGVNSSLHTDVDKTVVFESPKYYDGTSEADAVSTTFQQFKFVGNGTGSTSVTLGKKVGTGDSASGRNGLTFIQSDVPVTMDFDDGNVGDANIYGSNFQDVSGGLTWGTDTTHECIGNNFSGCTQFDPGSILIRACNFINTVDIDAALLWNGSINIKNSGFFANTAGAAIEHSAQGSFSYEGLNFSGNTNDILYSAAASSGVLTINASDSNPVSSEITNATGNSVSIVNTVTLTVTVKTQAGLAINGAAVRIQETDGTLISQGTTNISGVYSDATYNYTSNTAVQVRVRESSSGSTRYFPAVATGTITTNGLSVEVALIVDAIAST